MSPKVADPALRTALLETAARVIAEEGSPALSLRRLAREVGTSTMAIYTHFGGMDELRVEVRREGFARLGAHLAAVAETDDPVADLAQLGQAYFTNALENPNLYRTMFMEHPVEGADEQVGRETFDVLVEGVRRCMDAGRLRPADPVGLANQLWALTHGVVALHLSGFLTEEEAAQVFAESGLNLILAVSAG
jgi:AcrR family transcriptional regulator